jgi:hypothetical protein
MALLAPAAEITEDTWRGTLVDWSCKQAHVDQACPVGPNTREFALSIDGGILLRFDENGNKLTLKVLRERGAGGNTEAEAVGKREERLLKVESIRIGPGPVS